MKNKNAEYSRQKYGIIESSGTHPDKIYPISNSQSDIGKTLLSDFMSAMGGADRNHPVGFDLNVETFEAIKKFCNGKQIKVDELFGTCKSDSINYDFSDQSVSSKRRLQQMIEGSGYQRPLINTSLKDWKEYEQALIENGFELQDAIHNSKTHYLEPIIPIKGVKFHTFLTECKFDNVEPIEETQPIKRILYFGEVEYIVPDPEQTKLANKILEQKTFELTKPPHPLNLKIKEIFEESSRDGGLSVTVGISDDSGFTKDDLVEFYKLYREGNTKYKIIYQKKENIIASDQSEDHHRDRNGFIVLVDRYKVRNKESVKLKAPKFVIGMLRGRGGAKVKELQEKLSIGTLSIEEY